jgi:CDP-archaeol synthase
VLSNANWSLLVLQALWLSLPVLVAGIVHVCIIKAKWMRALAALSIDGGQRIGGRRLFGANKTVRGALIMPIVGAVASALQSRAPAQVIGRLSVAPFQINHPAIWGLLLGVGYVAGELPNSFIKRQLDIAPGAPSRGRNYVLFWLADQWDSVIGIFLVLGLVWIPDIRFVAVVFALALLLHTLVAVLMVAMGLKQRIG